MKTMTGRVTEINGRHVTVESPDAPSHLRTLDVLKPPVVSQTQRVVQVGDSVQLTYVTTPSFGLWGISAIL